MGLLDKLLGRMKRGKEHAHPQDAPAAPETAAPPPTGTPPPESAEAEERREREITDS